MCGAGQTESGHAAVQADPQNSNVYVGNVAPEVSDQELRRHFQQFGNVVEVKTYRKGSYGFVHFEVSCIRTAWLQLLLSHCKSQRAGLDTGDAQLLYSLPDSCVCTLIFVQPT